MLLAKIFFLVLLIMCKNRNSMENYLLFFIKYVFSLIFYNDKSNYQFSSCKIPDIKITLQLKRASLPPK